MKRKQTILSAILAAGILLAPLSAMALNVGDTAPAFTVDSTQGQIALADYQGKKHVVLALYFAVFTPV